MSEQVQWFDSWLKDICSLYTRLDAKLLRDTFSLCLGLGDVENFPFACSPLHMGAEIAEQVLLTHQDSALAAASLAFPTASGLELSRASLGDVFQADVAHCLNGALQMKRVGYSSMGSARRSQKNLNNIKKLILSMVDDVRMVEIKLAERLVVLKHARDLSDAEQKDQAEGVQRIFAPLANRLGMGDIKWQLEDLAFRYLDNARYVEISKGLQMRRVEREEYVTAMVAELKTSLDAMGIAGARISGRAKHIYSIYAKLKRKQTTLEDIYDTTATRVLVNSIKDCYAVLGMVQQRWPMIKGEFDDYIANPKPNGYQSIHTAIIGPKGRCVEIQIRTFQMHDQAEKGIASHWAYKEKGSTEQSYQEKIDALRHLMDWQTDVAGEQDRASIEKLFGDQIYVFTPGGDVVDLPQGSTPLDFAYHVHTDVGHCCKGAKVNGQLVPLTYQLETGDRIEVITAKAPKPSRDWINPNLGYLKTRRAQSKVMHWFKRHQHEISIIQGQVLAEKLQRKHVIKKNEWLSLVAAFHFTVIEDLYAALGKGEVGPATLENRLRLLRGEINEDIKKDVSLQRSEAKTDSSVLSIGGVDSIQSQFAKCCHPVPGDPVLGFVTSSKGIVIHHAMCQNLKQAKLQSQDRIFEVVWGENSNQLYVADLVVKAVDRKAILSDLSHVAVSEKVNMVSLNAKSDRIRRYVTIYVGVEVNSVNQLEHFMQVLKRMPDIIEVSRL